MERTKRFSQKLFDQNDPPARRIVKEYYKQKGTMLYSNPNKYGPDLVEYEKVPCPDCNGRSGCTTCGGLGKVQQIKQFVECEIKKVWKEEKFPYGDVQFPKRKAKYVYENNKPVTFCMLNAKCNKMLMVNGVVVLESPLQMIPNIYVKRDEWFFKVPLDKVKFVDIKQKEEQNEKINSTIIE